MEAGQTIAGKYRLNQPLGSGGMASVWSATNVFTERQFAIKFMHPQVASTPEAARRFLLEAKVSGRIHHPNIIEMIDVGQAEDNSLFLVMELLDGVSLDVAVRHRNPPMRVAELMAIMRDIACALAEVHRAGVIHRDLKPTNVFLHRDRDGRLVPKLLDFGVSKVLGGDAEGALTVVGTILGSPFYMSPEQAIGADGIDGRTDVFAFGAILFEALCGQRAYGASNLNALIVAIATTPPRDIGELAPHLPESLRSLVRECMVRDKAGRLASFADIARRIDAMMPELDRPDLVLPPPVGGDPNVSVSNVPAASSPGSMRKRTSDRPPAAAEISGSSSPPISIPMSAPVFVPESSAVPSVPPPARGARSAAASVIAVAAGVALIVAVAGFVRRTAPTHAISLASLTRPTRTTEPAAAAIAEPSPTSSTNVPTVSVDALPVAARSGAHARAPGKLTVTAGPGSCALAVDGQPRGTTPLHGLELTAGAHEVDCTPAGGKAKTANVTLTDGAESHYHFTLPE